MVPAVLSHPDLILTDLFMPKMGGDEMTAALRAQGVDVPIIGMTAAAIASASGRTGESA